MMDFLERHKILHFHPSIKTHRQKVHTLIYAAIVVISFTAILFIAVSALAQSPTPTPVCPEHVLTWPEAFRDVAFAFFGVIGVIIFFVVMAG